MRLLASLLLLLLCSQLSQCSAVEIEKTKQDYAHRVDYAVTMNGLLKEFPEDQSLHADQLLHELAKNKELNMKPEMKSAGRNIGKKIGFLPFDEQNINREVAIIHYKNQDALRTRSWERYSANRDNNVCKGRGNFEWRNRQFHLSPFPTFLQCRTCRQPDASTSTIFYNLLGTPTDKMPNASISQLSQLTDKEIRQNMAQPFDPKNKYISHGLWLQKLRVYDPSIIYDGVVHSEVGLIRPLLGSRSVSSGIPSIYQKRMSSFVDDGHLLLVDQAQTGFSQLPEHLTLTCAQETPTGDFIGSDMVHSLDFLGRRHDTFQLPSESYENEWVEWTHDLSVAYNQRRTRTNLKTLMQFGEWSCCSMCCNLTNPKCVANSPYKKNHRIGVLALELIDPSRGIDLSDVMADKEDEKRAKAFEKRLHELLLEHSYVPLFSRRVFETEMGEYVQKRIVKEFLGDYLQLRRAAGAQTVDGPVFQMLSCSHSSCSAITNCRAAIPAIPRKEEEKQEEEEKEEEEEKATSMPTSTQKTTATKKRTSSPKAKTMTNTRRASASPRTKSSSDKPKTSTRNTTVSPTISKTTATKKRTSSPKAKTMTNTRSASASPRAKSSSDKSKTSIRNTTVSATISFTSSTDIDKLCPGLVVHRINKLDEKLAFSTGSHVLVVVNKKLFPGSSLSWTMNGKPIPRYDRKKKCDKQRVAVALNNRDLIMYNVDDKLLKNNFALSNGARNTTVQFLPSSIASASIFDSETGPYLMWGGIGLGVLILIISMILMVMFLVKRKRRKQEVENAEKLKSKKKRKNKKNNQSKTDTDNTDDKKSDRTAGSTAVSPVSPSPIPSPGPVPSPGQIPSPGLDTPTGQPPPTGADDEYFQLNAFNK